MFYFESGTDTPKTTYADVNLSIANTNPVILTADGRLPNVWFDGTARMKLTNEDDVQIWDIDPVGGEDIGGNFEEWNTFVIYSINDIVIGSDNKYYRSFTSGNEGNDPTTSPDEWEQVEFISVWNTNVIYDIGDTVKASDNNFWSSVTSSNQGNDPTLDTGDWEVPFDLSSPGPIGDTTASTGEFTTINGVVPATELEAAQVPTAISTAGVVSGADADLSQAISRYAATGAIFYSDGGSANQYVLSALGDFITPDEYLDGMTIGFRPANTNTGASTVNVTYSKI